MLLLFCPSKVCPYIFWMASSENIVEKVCKQRPRSPTVHMDFQKTDSYRHIACTHMDTSAPRYM